MWFLIFFQVYKKKVSFTYFGWLFDAHNFVFVSLFFYIIWNYTLGLHIGQNLNNINCFSSWNCSMEDTMGTFAPNLIERELEKLQLKQNVSYDYNVSNCLFDSIVYLLGYNVTSSNNVNIQYLKHILLLNTPKTS